MKLLVLDVAALGYDLWSSHRSSDFWRKLEVASLDTVFPALTASVQASFRTGLLPSEHGMIANGFYDRKLCKTFFWEQSSFLYDGGRIWDKFRRDGGSVGQICWQQSIGPDSDLILSPSPIHRHHGGMIQDFYSEPGGLYRSLCGRTREEFNLASYWGPFTSISSSRWIADAVCHLLYSNEATDILLAYIPHLDYDLQRYGPGASRAKSVFLDTEKLIEKIFVSAKLAGYEMAIFGDYSINQAEQVIYPNRILWDQGYFTERNVKGHYYPDLYNSDAFAMCDHQIAHIYVKDKNMIGEIKDGFAGVEGIKRVLSHDELNHERSGELILEAAAGCWFAYPWWEKPENAPDYASHVDIHNKPGYDPCELFMSLWPPFTVSQDARKVKGTHGATGNDEHKILWASSFKLDSSVKNIVDAARMVRGLLG